MLKQYLIHYFLTLKVPGYITSPSETGHVCTYSMVGNVFSLSGTPHISLTYPWCSILLVGKE